MTLDEYISIHSTPENAVLESLTRDTHVHVLNPHMLSGHVQGRVLSMMSHMIRPKRILELGTFTGYSALCLAEGLAEGGRLVTIEHNDELEETIRRNLSRSSLCDRIELRIGDCKEILSNDERALSWTNDQYDLVFIDADKREYCEYLELVYPLVPVGGRMLSAITISNGMRLLFVTLTALHLFRWSQQITARYIIMIRVIMIMIRLDIRSKR